MNDERKCHRRVAYDRRRRPVRMRTHRVAALLRAPENRHGLLAALIDLWVATQPNAWLTPGQVSQILIPCPGGELVAMRVLVHHMQYSGIETQDASGVRAWLRANSGRVHRGHMLVVDEPASLVGVVPIPGDREGETA